jgi:leucyl aminopeptidase
MQAWVRFIPHFGFDHWQPGTARALKRGPCSSSVQLLHRERARPKLRWADRQRGARTQGALKDISAKAGAPFNEVLPDDCTPEKSLEWGQRLLGYAGRYRHSWCTEVPSSSVTPIDLLDITSFENWLGKQSDAFQSWLRSVESLPAVAGADSRELFCQCIPEQTPSTATTLEVLPPLQGTPHTTWSVLVRIDTPVAVEECQVPWSLAAIPTRVPPGTYYIRKETAKPPLSAVALAWALGCYTFDAYKNRDPRTFRKLFWQPPEGTSMVDPIAEAAYLVRDLINAPAEHLGPAALEACSRALAHRHGGSCCVVKGDALLQANFPQIHAVGRAAASRHAPRLIEIHFPGQLGNQATDVSLPLIAVIGKGVTFDSGGLDIKPAQAMRLMKKDMGGAAHALGLAHLLRADVQLAPKHRLCVLLPAVENAISGSAFRPGDILTARNGLTTEVGNTDAEGRLILADALAYAAEMQPAYIIDFATLTGAARVALGTDLPALFCTHDQIAREAVEIGSQIGDPVWQMPLHRAYRKMLRSKVADLQNISDSPYAGAILAALYLGEFVRPERGVIRETPSLENRTRPLRAGDDFMDTVWVHVDLMAYALGASAGRPEGGIEQGLYTLYHLLRRRMLDSTNP